MECLENGDEATDSYVHVADDYIEGELCMWSYVAVWNSYILCPLWLTMRLACRLWLEMGFADVDVQFGPCGYQWERYISILTKLFLALAQCCAMLCNCCKPNQLCRDSDKLLRQNCSVVSYDHYMVSASFVVRLYASQTQPESANNLLFADVVVVIIDDNNSYSSSASRWVALKRFWAGGFAWYMP